jgi:hypothetical protein
MPGDTCVGGPAPRSQIPKIILTPSVSMPDRQSQPSPIRDGAEPRLPYAQFCTTAGTLPPFRTPNRPQRPLPLWRQQEGQTLLPRPSPQRLPDGGSIRARHGEPAPLTW